MKKLIALVAAALLVVPAVAKDKEKKADKDSLIFTTIIENPITSIKNQNSSGTCWAYSSLAFLESEAIKKNPALKEDLDLCAAAIRRPSGNGMRIAGRLSPCARPAPHGQSGLVGGSVDRHPRTSSLVEVEVAVLNLVA